MSTKIQSCVVTVLQLLYVTLYTVRRVEIAVAISLITSGRITSQQQNLYHREAHQIPEVMQQKAL